MSYLFLDCETGGLDPKVHSLLTIGCDFVEDINDTPTPIASFNTAVFHEVYNVDPKALEVNHIDLVVHSKAAQVVSNIRSDFSNWLRQMNPNKHTIVVVGWNVGFDLGFIWAQLFTRSEWSALGISYRALDVCALVEFLKLQGKLPKDLRGSLVSVAEYFGMDTRPAHNASYDNLLCRSVLRELVNL